MIYEEELRKLEPLLGKKETRYYYIKNFTDIIIEGKTASWNWAAFISPQLWFVYRKMYAYGILFWIASLVAMFVPLLFVLLLAAHICIGVLGNYIYLTRLLDLSETAKSMPDMMRQDYLKKYGGEAETGSILMLAGMAFFYLALLFPAIAFFGSR